MIRQLSRFLALLTVACLTFGIETAVFAQTADSDPAAGDSKPAAKPPKTRTRVTMKLPDEYRSKDKDKDGQIGMYEWSKTDYATFRKLDLNGDGFLTPLELSRAGRSKRSVSAEVVSTSSDSTSTGSSAPAATTVAGDAAAASDAPTTAPTAGKGDAERLFDEFIDKDKDGRATEEEFKKSAVAKMKFSKAGIVLTFPVGRAEFLRLYPVPTSEPAK